MKPSNSAALSEPFAPAENAIVDTAPPTCPDPEGADAPAPYFLRTSTVVAIALLAGIFFLLNVLPLWYTDVWGHVKYGQWIVEHRSLPAQEPFSPFAADVPYLHFQWLTQSGLYLLYQFGAWLAGGDELHRLAGGADVVRSLFVLVSMLRYIVLLLAYRRLSGSMRLACVGLALTFVFSNKMQRPQFFGELFFACLLWALSRPVLSRRALLLVPLCLVLWANMHASFLVGLILLGVCFLGRLVEAGRIGGAWSFTRAARDVQVRRLFVAGLISALAVALLNPHGPRLIPYVLQFSKNPNIPTLEEWQPLNFTGGLTSLGGYLFLLLLLLVSQAFSPRSLSVTHVLLLGSFGVFPLIQQRMLTWWVMVMPCLLLPMWAGIGERLPLLQQRSEPTARKTMLAGFLVAVCLLWSLPVQWLLARGPHKLEKSLSPGTPWRLAEQLTAVPGERKDALPELAAALRQDYPDGRFQGCIFASETQGDYLFWALPPEYPVFAYSHVHLLPHEHWLDILTVKGAGDGWWEILDRYGVNLVVVEVQHHAAFVQALRDDPAWRVVLDETNTTSKRDPRLRVFIALRKQPRPLMMKKN